MLMLLIKGLIMGFSIAAPVGPIGILCINRTLSSGLQAGLMSGLGAATADAVYGCIAGFGLVAVSTFLLSQAGLIKIAGGAFLLYIGLKFLFLAPAEPSQTDGAKTLGQDFYSTFLLTLMNPFTILSFVAIFTSFGIVAASANYLEAIVIVLGVFLGSLLWWVILSVGIHSIRHRVNDIALRVINVLSGLIVGGFGLFTLFSQTAGP